MSLSFTYSDFTLITTLNLNVRQSTCLRTQQCWMSCGASLSLIWTASNCQSQRIYQRRGEPMPSVVTACKGALCTHALILRMSQSMKMVLLC